MKAAALLALALPLAAAGQDPLAGRIAGPPARCISLGQVTGPEIVDDGTILYRQNGRRIWRADLIGRCPGLRRDYTLITEVFGGQLCRNDKFRVLQPGLTIPGPYCRFGGFTPYDRR